MRIKLDDLPIHLRKQAQKKLRDTPTVRDSKPEPDEQDAPCQTNQDTQFREVVHITVHVWRKGDRWDADNIETKGLVDGLVEEGILGDDTIQEAPVVTRHGHPCDTKEEEKTVIVIKEID